MRVELEFPEEKKSELESLKSKVLKKLDEVCVEFKVKKWERGEIRKFFCPPNGGIYVTTTYDKELKKFTFEIESLPIEVRPIGRII